MFHNSKSGEKNKDKGGKERKREERFLFKATILHGNVFFLWGL